MTTNFPATRSERLKPFDLTVEVDQDFIDNGVKDDMCGCPIALAIKAKLPKGFKESALVAPPNVRVVIPGFTECWAEVSPEMKVFIRDFDAGKEVKPCSFSLCFHPVDEG